MDSEARNPDTERLRLVDLRIDGEHLLHFGGGLSGVLASNGTRTTAAYAIAYTIVGPRPSGASGAIDIAGTLVSVWSLPSPMLSHDEPVLVDRDLVRRLFANTLVSRRAQLAAAHATCMLEGQRIEAELAALGVEPAVEAVLDEAPEPAAPVEATPADPDAELAVFMESVRAYGRVESLVAALEPEPLAEALHLADLVDSNAAMMNARDTLGHAAIDVEAADRRVKLARVEVAMTSGGVSPEQRREIERRHRDVVEAEAHLSEVGRRRRPRALARYDAAVAMEQKALADAGIDSYAMFLMALTSGDARPDDRARQAAQDELASATAAYEQAVQLANLPSRDDLAARAELLREHARTLLGREPGRELAGELRALRVPRADHDERMRELVGMLREVGVEVGHDPVADARRYLRTPPSIHIEQKPAWPMPDARWSGRIDQSEAFAMPGTSPQPVEELRPVAPPEPVGPPEPVAPPEAARSAVELARIESLEHELDAQRQELAALETEMRELESMRDADLGQLSPTALQRAMESTLDAYRAGSVLAGRVPIVFDGVLDRVSPEACDAALAVLAGAADLQAIIVSNEPPVMQRIRDAGGTIVHWPDPETERQGAAQFTG
jgi:hypothetical protein